MTIKKSKLIYYDCIFAREHHSDAPGMSNWSKAHRFFGNNTCLIDRSFSISMPFKCRVFPWLEIPSMQHSRDRFDTICFSAADSIWQRAIKKDQQISVMWSGGIDSTLALSSLLMTAPAQQLHRLTVLLSRESMIEYPWYYHNVIKNKLKVGASDAWYQWVDPNCIIVTGEGGDQLINGGFYRLRKFVQEQEIKASSADTTIKLLSLASKDPTYTYESVVEPLVASAKCDLEFPLSDIWWSVFCLDWQSRYLTLMNNLPEFKRPTLDDDYLENNWIMFFQSPEMQTWAMNTQHVFLDSGLDNKKILKDIIYQHTQDRIYRDNKTKKSSMMNVKRSNPSNAGITADFEFVGRIDDAYLNLENSFL